MGVTNDKPTLHRLEDADDSRTFDRAFDDAIACGRMVEENRALYKAIWIDNPRSASEVVDYLKGKPGTWFGDPPPARNESAIELASVTYNELVADSQLLDRVFRVICLECDCDYLTAIEKFEEWRESTPVARGTSSGDLALKAIVEPVMTFDRLSKDVTTLEREQEKQHEAMILSKDITPKPEGDVTADGRVKLPSNADPARLLTDPYELERAYLEVQKYTREYAGDKGRRLFEKDFRAHVEAGFDLVGTLQLARRRDELAKTEMQAVERQLLHEENERKKRAHSRQVAEEIRSKINEL